MNDDIRGTSLVKRSLMIKFGRAGEPQKAQTPMEDRFDFRRKSRARYPADKYLDHYINNRNGFPDNFAHFFLYFEMLQFFGG